MPSSSIYVAELPEREDVLQMLYMTVGANDNLKVALASREALGGVEQMGTIHFRITVQREALT